MESTSMSSRRRNRKNRSRRKKRNELRNIQNRIKQQEELESISPFTADGNAKLPIDTLIDAYESENIIKNWENIVGEEEIPEIHLIEEEVVIPVEEESQIDNNSVIYRYFGSYFY